MVVVEVDGDFLEGFEGADDAFDADPGGVLEVAGDGQGGHDHGQVSLDRVSSVVEDRSGSQVVLAHPEGLPGRATARGRRRPPHRHSSSVQERKVAYPLSPTRERALAMDASSRT